MGAATLPTPASPGRTQRKTPLVGSGASQTDLGTKNLNAILDNSCAPGNPYGAQSIEKLRAEIKWVEPQLARHLRDTCAFEWQRAIDSRNVERLSSEMKRGWFVAGTPVTVAVLPDNSMRLLNGNHTMEAIHASGVTIPVTFIFTRVSDLNEAGKIYATLDIQRVRTWVDSLRATGKGEFPLSSKSMSALGLIMQDFVFSTSNVEVNSSRNLRFGAMEDYRTAATIIEHALHGAPGANKRMLSRSAFLAVALATARYQPSTAVEFWKAAAFDDGLSRNDPRKALLTYGINNSARGGSDNTVHARAAALAWNAYFEGRPLEYCKPNQTTEFRLSGTPWSGRRKPSAIETGVEVSAAGLKPVSLFKDMGNAH
jgi:hypothetical protein